MEAFCSCAAVVQTTADSIDAQVLDPGQLTLTLNGGLTAPQAVNFTLDGQAESAGAGELAESLSSGGLPAPLTFGSFCVDLAHEVELGDSFPVLPGPVTTDRGSASASWQVTGLSPGTYDVQVTWQPDPGAAAADATYLLYDGDTLVATAEVDQRQPPAGLATPGATFQSLGRVTVQSGTLRVALADDPDGPVVADAVLVTPAPAGAALVDDAQAGYAETGAWSASPGGYSGDARSAPAGHGQAHHLSPQAGDWAVRGGRYDATPAPGGDALSTLLTDSPLPASLELDVTLSAATHSGYASNGFLIFDYQGPTDFKFAGAYFGLQEWVIGHRDANGWEVDAALSDPAIAAGTDYDLQLLLRGGNATLLANGRAALGTTYAAPFTGAVGLGTENSPTRFDDLTAHAYTAPLPPGSTLVDDGQPGYAETGTWSPTLGGYDGSARLNPADPVDVGLAHNAGRIAYLYNHYGTTSLDPWQAAGLQVAIWELESDAVPDLSSGNFQLPDGSDPGVLYWANYYLSDSAGQDEAAAFLDVTLGGRPGEPSGPAQSMLIGDSLNFANVVVPQATSSLAGSAYLDANGNGTRDPGEAALAGLAVTLTGTDDHGNAVSATATTADDGSYDFTGLAPGTYALTEAPPAGYADVRAAAGTAGGSAAANTVGAIALGPWVNATGYTFGAGNEVHLVEGSNFLTEYRETLTLPAHPSALAIHFDGLQFDTSDSGRIKDAFELALVDAQGRPLAATVRQGRDAFFSVTEGQAPLPGAATQYDPTTGTVTVDVSHLTPGSSVTLVARLINDDHDTATEVTLDPAVSFVASPFANPSTSVPFAPAGFQEPIDPTHLGDVTPSVSIAYQATTFDDATSLLRAGVSLTNAGSYAITGPLLVAIRGITAPSVRVANPDGILPDGTPYYDVSQLAFSAGHTTFAPGDTVSGLDLVFSNPQHLRFDYQLEVLGHANTAPHFTSAPLTEVVAGQPYAYLAQAQDAENDPLTYDTVAAPAGLHIAANGQVRWDTTGVAPGDYSVVLRVTDHPGGLSQPGALSDEQSYALLVTQGVPDRPPHFTSTPVVAAFVATAYDYPATATDPDGDALTFAVVAGPAGLAINASSGAVTWTPTAAQLGPQPVTLAVDDGRGGSDTQSFTVVVGQQPGNHPPMIISTPVTTVAAGVSYQYPVEALDPDQDPLTYALGAGAPAGMTIDAHSGLITWPTGPGDVGGPYPVTVTASDGKGGSDAQSFAVAVTAAVGIFGSAWDDLNANGLWDGAYVNGGGGPLQPIDLQDVPLAEDPLAVGYDAPQQALLVAAGAVSGQDNPLDLLLLHADGTLTPFASVAAPNVEEISMAVVPPGNSAGFVPGDVFLPGHADTAIARVTADGTTVSDDWADVTGGNGTFDMLTFDTTGLFGDDLLALDGSRQLWQIDASGNATLLASNVEPGAIDGSMLVLPDDPALYGPLAGQLLIVSEAAAAVAVSPPDASGQCAVTTVSGTGLDAAEGLAIATPAGNFFGVADDDGGMAVAAGQSFAPIAGQLVVAHEAGPAQQSFQRVWWDGTQLQTADLPFTASSDTARAWEQVAFLPAALGPVGLTMEPALPGVTVYLDTNGNGQLDPGEPIGVTDSQGRYAFPGLAPGSYTVREVVPPGWTQTAPSGGAFSVSLAAGQAITDLDFGNHTEATGTNQPPQIVSTAPLDATVGQPYAYDVVAQDADGDALSFALTQAPAGMAVGTNTGVIMWTPVTGQVGPFGVTVVVSDGQGGTDSQTFTVVGHRSGLDNQPPHFTSTPLLTARADSRYRYDATALDPDGDPLLFDLPVHPDGMTVSGSHGTVVWQPTFDEVGQTFDVLLRVQDDHGGVDLQSFRVTVALPDVPPVVTSAPPGTAYAGLPFTYTVHAQEADNGPLTYTLTSGPAGMQFDPAHPGTLEWTPDPSLAGQAEPVALTVTDDLGGTATQSFTLTVAAPVADRPPVITSTPRTQIGLGLTYLYQVTATDPDNDPLSYALVSPPAGMSIDTFSGLVTWTPAAAQVGGNAIHVQVSDGRGGVADQTFTLTVTAQAHNQAPVIASAPQLNAVVGEGYAYDAAGSDPDGDPLLWSLEKAPFGLSLNARDGTLRWTPRAEQAGPQDVVLRLSDPYGGSTTQSFTINVWATNQPPQISSTPPTETAVDQPYRYAVAATDPDGDTALTYNLNAAAQADGLSIDATGVVSGTPYAVGSVPVVVTVADGYGGTDAQSYALQVDAAPPNQPPAITSDPVTAAAVGEDYAYQVVAGDPDGDSPLTYTLSGQPSGMSIGGGGLVSWGAASVTAGSYALTVRVADPAGAFAEQSYTLVASVNQPPTITSMAPTTITAGLTYRYDVQADDPDGDALTYALTAAPSGMSIDPDGRISWATDATVIGAHEVTVQVSDGRGATATQDYTLAVQADTQAPQVQLEIDPTEVDVGQQVVFVVEATDNVGVTALSLTVGGTAVALDADGRAVVTMSTLGDVMAVATASDAAGNTATTGGTVEVIDPSVTNPPVVSISSPAEGATVTAPVDVVGSVSAQGPVTWTLSVVPADGSPTRVIATGTTPVSNAVLGQFDPTLLADGSYALELTARDTGGHTTTAVCDVEVQGQLKLGNFHLDFTDLTIPVAGIPITITRSYDTLNAGVSGDFGYGWSLNVGGYSVSVDQSTTGPGYGGYPAFEQGTRVLVTHADGTVDGYTFDPQPGEQFGSAVFYYIPYFQPDPGVVNALVADQDVELTEVSDGEYVVVGDSGDLDYNPIAFGNAYQVVQPDGTDYTINATTGALTNVSDRNGNELTISDSGITSNSGVQVTFNRDPQGRILSITDPNGNSLQYTYDANGNLATFTDRLANVTTFTYSTDVAHSLQQVNDPLGRAAEQTTYYPDGRVEQMTDAAGKTIQYTYNTGTLVQTTTDQLGNTSSVTFDSLGNVIRQVSAAGVITVNQYSDPNNPTLVTSTTTVNDNLTTTSTYDASGDLTSTTAPDGTVTRTYYDSFGEPISQVDAAGNATTSSFDDSGNLVQISAPNGMVAGFSYDDAGDPTQITTNDGQALVTNTYDGTGDLTEVTPAAGRQTFSAYDADGNQIATWYFDGTGSNQVQVLDLTTYNAAGQVTGASRAVLPSGQFITRDFATATIPSQYISYTTATTYDADGKVLTSTSETGLQTQNIYDDRGELVEVRQQSIDATGSVVWTDTQTVYDAAGHTIATTEQYVEGTTAPIHGTLTKYDPDGNVIETDQVVGLVITLSGSGADIESVLTNPGTIVSSITSQYDSAGREDSSTDENGLVTQTIYGLTGEVLRTRQQSVDQNGNLVYLDTDTVYDSLGRVSVTTDSYIEGSSAPIYATRTVYDDLGRAVQSIRLVGVQITVANGVSTLTDPGTELWSMQTAYDGEGRVSRQIAAGGQITDYEYDSLGRQTAEVGTPESLADAGLTPAQFGLADGTGVTVRLRTETVYDPVTGKVQEQETNIREIILPDGSIMIDRSAEEDTSYQYDAFGNLIQTTYADGTTTRSTYDAFGRKTADTNQLGQTTTYQYDADNRLISVTQPAVVNPATGQMQQPVYTYAYDALGNQVLIRDPLGHETRFTYDDQGHELTRTLPLGYGPGGAQGSGSGTPADWTESYQYDVRGREILHISFEGVVTQLIYDPQTGRLAQENFYDSVADYNDGQGTPNEVWTFAYDAFGRQVEVTQTPSGGTPGVTQEQYDGQGNLTEVTSPQGTVSYAYDNLGRRIETIVGPVSDPLRTISYTYNALGRLHTVTDALTAGATPNTTQVTSYQYDLLGNVLQTNLPNGAFDVDVYNSMSQLLSLTEYAPDAAKIAEFDYTPRADGTDAAVTETFWTTAGPLTNTFTWSYDSLGRLTSEVLNSSDSSRSYTATYTYDLAGNRVQFTETGAVTETITSSYDANDRLSQVASSLGTTTTYGYSHTEETSQVVTQSDGSSVNTSYSYDLHGNMQTATVDTQSSSGALLSREKLTYGYDADGIRVSVLDQIDSSGSGTWSQQTETEYLNDPQNFTGNSQVLRETHTDLSTGQITEVIDYTWGLQGIAQTVSSYTDGQLAGRSTDVFGTDGHGSVRVLTSMAAALVQVYSYDAYGNVVGVYDGAGQFVSSNAASALTTYLYDGQQFDARIGMQYLRARYYDPSTGTFGQLDPFFGNMQDPLSLNKYLYAQDNPVNGIDPTGWDDANLPSLTTGLGSSESLDGTLGNAALRVFSQTLKSLLLFTYEYRLPLLILASNIPALLEEYQDINDLVNQSQENNNGACFAAGTPLLTPEGSKPIEQFRVGDLVLSRGEADPAGEVEAKAVHEVFVQEARVLELRVAGRVIRTTAEHPFWVAGKGWVAAGELAGGDLLLSAEGGLVAVEQVAQTAEHVRVYNLRIADFHTYFVGCDEWGFSVWAHNICVSRWGRLGLQDSDFVMVGPVSWYNYILSFKWQPGMGNQFAPYSSGRTYNVPASTISWPTGWGIDGWWKGLYGQRIYHGPPRADPGPGGVG